jgi:hypothetical protein
MNNSTADPAELGFGTVGLDLPAWKKALSFTAAILLAIVFFVSGAWKLSDPFMWAQALTEFRVPAALSLPFTLALGAPFPPLGELVDRPAAGRIHDLYRGQLQRAGRQRLQLFPLGEAHHRSGILYR